MIQAADKTQHMQQEGTLGDTFGRCPFPCNQATLPYSGKITKYRTTLYDI
jgi:hypothetical protein